ncbi:GNAT family N-acetyltransferase [Streptomyces alboflavus]|uniref:GNAT family N-acetyltransferase n=1 Tax=Streptomyces alboflavus TaxID=67267 RepID=UPI0036ABD114
MIWWRRVAEENYGLLSVWFAQPHVARWWNHDASLEGIARGFGPAARGEEPSEDLLVMLGALPVGLVRRRRFTDHPRQAAELDGQIDVPAGSVTIGYLIGDPTRIGQGLGPLIIRETVATTWSVHEDAPAVVVPVPVAHRASWRALEKAGLRRVGSADLTPDNPDDGRAHYVYRVDRPSDVQATAGTTGKWYDAAAHHDVRVHDALMARSDSAVRQDAVAGDSAEGHDDAAEGDEDVEGHWDEDRCWPRRPGGLAIVFWLALPLALLWWGLVAAGTDGYDGEPCGEVGAFADRCVAALAHGEDWGGRYLLYAALLGLVLLALPAGDGLAATARRPVFALAMVCLLASVVVNANATRLHSEADERNNPAMRAPHSAPPSPPPS